MCGRKLWKLLPPTDTHLLFDRFGRDLAPHFTADEDRPGHFPNLAAARLRVIEIIQVLPSASSREVILTGDFENPSLLLTALFRRVCVTVLYRCHPDS